VKIFPVNFCSTFKNGEELLYVELINDSSENLPLGPIKMMLFSLIITLGDLFI